MKYGVLSTPNLFCPARCGNNTILRNIVLLACVSLYRFICSAYSAKKLNAPRFQNIVYILYSFTMALLRRATSYAGSLSLYPEMTIHDLPFTQKYDNFTYLGVIKNRPHYKNLYDEVFLCHSYGKLDYVADWLEEYKMLWTDYPVNYRLITVKKKDYFFDVHEFDTYEYDHNKNIVIPVGYYCPKKHVITKN